MAALPQFNQLVIPPNLTALEVVNLLWRARSPLVKSGLRSSMGFDLRIKARIGSKGVAELKNRYESLIEAPVTVVEDPVAGHLKLEPTQSLSGHLYHVQQTQGRMTRAKASKIARPPNAFILFRKHHHNEIKSSQPEMHNNEISKQLGNAWAQASFEEKNHFRQLANVLKEKHMREHPDYVYQPRKPGEKKRRMTRRKKEAMAKSSTAVNPLPKNGHGNIVLEFGDGKNKIEDLRAKIEEHNADAAPISNLHDRLIRTVAPTSIYSERSQDHHDQMNFFDEILGSGVVDPNLLDHPASMLVGTPRHYFQDFYQTQATNFTAEAMRMQAL